MRIDFDESVEVTWKMCLLLLRDRCMWNRCQTVEEQAGLSLEVGTYNFECKMCSGSSIVHHHSHSSASGYESVRVSSWQLKTRHVVQCLHSVAFIWHLLEVTTFAHAQQLRHCSKAGNFSDVMWVGMCVRVARIRDWKSESLSLRASNTSSFIADYYRGRESCLQ